MVDGLRGVAAMAVVCAHLMLVVDEASAGPWMWSGFRWLAGWGFLGVDIFFVLSGFVIAYSTRNGPHTFGYLGRFALRRSIRLDPPYWVTIALEMSLIALTMRFFPARATDLPTLAQIVAHVFYAQNLLGYGDIIDIFWTLCYEIQFYLFFVLLLIARRRVPNRNLSIVVLAGVFVASLVLQFTTADIHGLALERWYQFFMGVMAWWVVGKRVSPWVIGPVWLTVLGASIATNQLYQFVGVATSALIVTAGLRGTMGQWLTSAPLQFLGKISYSLYLIHLLAGWRFVALTGVLLGPFSVSMAWIMYFAGMIVSVLAAAALWWLVERPTIALSKRVRPVRAPETSSGLAPASV